MLFNNQNFHELCAQSKTRSRLRAHRTLHQSADDVVQRMLIAIQPESYVPAHCHRTSNQWEMLVVLQGKLDCLLFDDAGCLTQRHVLEAGGIASGIELSPSVWHSVVSQHPDTVMLEVKPGPYDPQKAAEFANWCPPENALTASDCREWMRRAKLGECYDASC